MCICSGKSVAIEATNSYTDMKVTVNAVDFLGEDLMKSPIHTVYPKALSDGFMLIYMVETPKECIRVTGTEQAKTLIKEIFATDALRKRSTSGAVANAAKNRTTNLVKTPYRAVKSLANKSSNIDSIGDAVLFAPEIVLHTTGKLIGGVGELAVTGARVTRGAAGTQCSGLNCIEKAGADVWSGVNSLAGKHNASRRLHAEFGTDPETNNKAYRRQIDRLAYAESYISTSIKLGGGNAGIGLISPVFTGVGYYNNGEFVEDYEDAHRQRNREKQALKSWGANPQTVDRFYKNKAYTKLYRRRLFRALASLPDARFRVRLFNDANSLSDRHKARSTIVTYEYLASLSSQNKIEKYVSSEFLPMIILKDQTLVLPLYADYMTLNNVSEGLLGKLAKGTRQKAIHVLGNTAPEFRQKSKTMNVIVQDINLNSFQ